MLTEIKPTLDRRFLVKIDDKEFVLYDGLLNLAHEHDLQKLLVKHIQLPSRDNGMECICKATAIIGSGKVFTDIGDANPFKYRPGGFTPSDSNGKHSRQSQSLARDLTNIGMTALEELGGHADAMPGNEKGVE